MFFDTLFFLSLLVGALLSLLLYVHQRQSKLDRLTEKWPQPPSWPLLGHLPIVAPLAGRDSINRATQMIRQYTTDHRCKLLIGTRLYLFDCNPKDIKALCTARQLLGKNSDYNVFNNWVGEGVFTSPVSKWIHRRKMLTPAFNYTMIKGFVEIFERQSHVLVKRLREVAKMEKPVDFLNIVNGFTLDTICETALGVTVGAQTGKESAYFNAVNDILEIIDARIKNILYRIPWFYGITALAARERQVLQTLHGFTERIIRQRLSELDKKPESTLQPIVEERHPLSFLDTLLHAKGPEGESLRVQDIREEVDTIIFGGFELTGTTMTFFIYLMTEYLQYQEQCREEIWQVCGKDPSTAITFEQVRQLHYLDMCVKETLRMYPSAVMIARYASENVTINDFFIPKGSNVLISPMYMGRCKDFFPEPNTFKPQRWASDAEQKIEPATFIPFMMGSRSCLGQRYAMIEMKVALAHLLRSFVFEPVADRQTPVGLAIVVTLHAAKTFYCHVRSLEA